MKPHRRVNLIGGPRSGEIAVLPEDLWEHGEWRVALASPSSFLPSPPDAKFDYVVVTYRPGAFPWIWSVHVSSKLK